MTLVGTRKKECGAEFLAACKFFSKSLHDSGFSNRCRTPYPKELVVAVEIVEPIKDAPQDVESCPRMTARRGVTNGRIVFGAGHCESGKP